MSSQDDEEIKRRREENQRRHEQEQGFSMMGDTLPPVWRRIYENLILSGFTSAEAMQVLLAYVHGFAGGKFIV